MMRRVEQNRDRHAVTLLLLRGRVVHSPGVSSAPRFWDGAGHQLADDRFGYWWEGREQRRPGDRGRAGGAHKKGVGLQVRQFVRVARVG